MISTLGAGETPGQEGSVDGGVPCQLGPSREGIPTNQAPCLLPGRKLQRRIETRRFVRCWVRVRVLARAQDFAQTATMRAGGGDSTTTKRKEEAGTERRRGVHAGGQRALHLKR